MFPPILLSIPYTILMGKLGLTNSRIGLIIMYLSFSVPYAVWLLIGFFKTVPLGIEEAACIDGANKLQVFVKVVLPNVAPGVVAVAIYTFINEMCIRDSHKGEAFINTTTLFGSPLTRRLHLTGCGLAEDTPTAWCRH